MLRGLGLVLYVALNILSSWLVHSRALVLAIRVKLLPPFSPSFPPFLFLFSYSLSYPLPSVNQLNPDKSPQEQGIEETAALGKKLFFSDQNVDRDDPIQLNQLYVQVTPPQYTHIPFTPTFHSPQLTSPPSFPPVP